MVFAGVGFLLMPACIEEVDLCGTTTPMCLGFPTRLFAASRQLWAS